jgi:hypothetical protein
LILEQNRVFGTIAQVILGNCKMSKSVFLMHSGGNLVEMVEQKYASEDILQALIAKYPHLLAGETHADTKCKWLLVTREAAIGDHATSNGRWSLDHLFIDSAGVPTLVEVKRSTDTRLRREVVGQMLDYAANAIVYWPIEQVRTMHESRCEQDGIDPEMCLREFVGTECDVETFWKTVKTNLQAGRIRMVFLADEIPSELRRVIEFLNMQMDPAEVIGVELKQYVGSNVKTLVPALIGQTSGAAARKNEPREQRQWDEVSFMQELHEQSGADATETAKAILTWVRPRVNRLWFGSGARSGSIFPVLDRKGTGHTFFALWTYGSVECLFQYFRGDMKADSKKKHLANLLNEIPGVIISGEMLSKRPSIDLQTLADPASLQKFFSAFQWAMDETKNA